MLGGGTGFPVWESLQQGHTGDAEERFCRQAGEFDAIDFPRGIVERVGHRQVHLVEVAAVVLPFLLLGFIALTCLAHFFFVTLGCG